MNSHVGIIVDYRIMIYLKKELFYYACNEGQKFSFAIRLLVFYLSFKLLSYKVSLFIKISVAELSRRTFKETLIKTG